MGQRQTHRRLPTCGGRLIRIVAQARSRRGLLVCGQVAWVAAATAGGLAAMASRNACSLV
jgi:hypothetical protein